MSSVPAGEMPKPDQDLLDGHFAGEHSASPNTDHKVRSMAPWAISQ